MKEKSNKLGARGRSPKSHIDYFRTKVWYYELSRFVINTPEYRQLRHLGTLNAPPFRTRCIGYASPYCIRTLVDGRYGEAAAWKKYRDGNRAAENYGREGAVTRAAKIWPHTKQIFYSPIWSILKGTRVELNAIIQSIEELDSEARIPILEGGFQGWNTGEGKGQTTEDLMVQLSQFPTWQCLQGIILLLGWADNIGNINFWNAICGLYRHMIPELIRRGNIPFYKEMFDLVDQVALWRTFPADNVRVDEFEAWTEQLPRLEEIERELEEMAQREFEAFTKFQMSDEEFFGHPSLHEVQDDT